MTDSNGRGWVLGAVGLGVGLLIGYLAAPRDEASVNPAERELNADLYTQTAAEYEALCEQSYRYAWECLQRNLKKPPENKLPPAIVLDLDETVLDNSRYQSWLYRNGKSFDSKTWAVWEKDYASEVGLVPGAGDFLKKVEQMKDPAVAVIYITNRRELQGTVEALRQFDLATPGIENRMYLRIKERDKEARRKLVRDKYRVLLYIGDQLGDFISDFWPGEISKTNYEAQVNAIRKRHEEVKKHRGHFGEDWIILPNSVYGEWLDILGENSAAHLHRTKFKVP